MERAINGLRPWRHGEGREGSELQRLGWMAMERRGIPALLSSKVTFFPFLKRRKRVLCFRSYDHELGLGKGINFLHILGNVKIREKGWLGREIKSEILIRSTFLPPPGQASEGEEKKRVSGVI